MKKNHKITEIQFKRNNIVKIFIDEKIFVETDNIVISNFDLYIGKEVSTEIVEKLRQKGDFSRAKIDVIRFLSYRPRSEREICIKLKRKNYPDITIKQTIAWLLEKNLLNDREFSKMWIKGRMANKPVGKIKIKKELEQKGINSNIIEDVIKNFFEKDTDELEVAHKFIENKRKSLKLKNIKLEPKKAINILKNRGFSYNVINSIYNDFFND